MSHKVRPQYFLTKISFIMFLYSYALCFSFIPYGLELSYSSAQKWSQHSNIHNLEEERFACYSLDALLMAFCTLLITYFLLITRKTIFHRSLFYSFKTVINGYLNRLEFLFGLIIHFISVLNESYFSVCIMYVSKI